MIKRRPLLADLFLATTKSKVQAVVPPAYWETTRDNLMLAKRFVFDHQAAGYCAELLRKAPRVIADAQDFAIPPFERMYIEFPFDVWYETLTGQKPDKTADIRLGYLITGSLVRVLVESPAGLGLSPIQYHLNRPWTFEQEQQMAEAVGTSRAQFDLFFWGVSAAHLGTIHCGADGKHRVAMDEWQKEALRSLRANHSLSLHVAERLQHRVPQIWDMFYDGSAGDLRNIIGLLLFMNRTSKTRVEREMPVKQQMIHTKPVALLKHRVITLHVNPVPKLLKLAAGEGVWRRLHDVRGHFCHNEVARTNHHDHEWQEAVSMLPHLQWFCSCGGLRWWRREHRRGHEQLGHITSVYEVAK
jgi:hypothetical protein